MGCEWRGISRIEWLVGRMKFSPFLPDITIIYIVLPRSYLFNSGYNLIKTYPVFLASIVNVYFNFYFNHFY